MHLVHKSLIPILPRKQVQNLVWDVSLIADELFYLSELGDDEIHDITVKVKSYPLSHFLAYCRLVIARAIELGINYSLDIDTIAIMSGFNEPMPADIFGGWMDMYYFIEDCRYLERHCEAKVILDAEKVWYEIC